MANELEVGNVRSECIEALMKLEASQRVTVLQGLIKMFNLRASCCACGGAIDTHCAPCRDRPPQSAA
jgi:hypothetical protein